METSTESQFSYNQAREIGVMYNFCFPVKSKTL